jgi:aspartyl aminopeptidase
VALSALCDHSLSSQLAHDSDISLAIFFDHEEVGSGSLVGAASPLLPQTMDRILRSLSSADTDSADEQETAVISRANSFMLSLDMAHGLHPNYSSRHEPSHTPLLNAGLVLKENPNQRSVGRTPGPGPAPLSHPRQICDQWPDPPCGSRDRSPETDSFPELCCSK